jgi:hypothetical protein
MPRYGVETKLSPEEVIQRAVAFFGKEGVGLEVIDQGSCCASFEGGGGHVSVTVSQGEKTEVELVTREWDYDVKQFMRQIA